MHVFVADLEAPVLEPDDDHHLRRVLRVRAGEAVTVSDGRGGGRACTWTGDGLEVTGAVSREPTPTPVLTVGFALTKGDRPEWVTQKLTEVGVDVIVPFTAERSVAQWDDAKARRQHERLGRVAREAAMQSRRVWLPEVRQLTTFAALAASLGATGALAHPGGGPPTLERPALLVGPEGGFSDRELSSGLPLVGLGPTTFRAETATLAAGLAVSWLRAGTLSVTN